MISLISKYYLNKIGGASGKILLYGSLLFQDGMVTIFPIGLPFFFFFKILFIFREGKGGKERERNINVWLPPVCPLLGTWPATQACAPTGNQTGDPFVHRLVFSPLSHTSQGSKCQIFISLTLCIVSLFYFIDFSL